MATYIHPYRPDILARLRMVAESKLDEIEQRRSSREQQQQTFASAADADALFEKAQTARSNDRPEFSFSIYIDKMPICKNAVDLRYFDTLEEAIDGDTSEIIVSLHFTRSNNAEKHILKMQGVSSSEELTKEKSLEGFVPRTEHEQALARERETIRKEIELDQQRRDYEKLKEDYERLQSNPVKQEDELGLKKILQVLVTAGIERWKKGDFDASKPKRTPQDSTSAEQKLTRQQQAALELGIQIIEAFPEKEDFEEVYEVLKHLARRKDLIPLMLDMLDNEPDAPRKQQPQDNRQHTNPEPQTEEVQQYEETEEEIQEEDEPAPVNEPLKIDWKDPSWFDPSTLS